MGYEFMYNQEKNNEIADHLESYADAIDNLFILEGKSKDEVDEALKIVYKAVKDLRKGRPEKVFNKERYAEYMIQKRMDDED